MNLGKDSSSIQIVLFVDFEPRGFQPIYDSIYWNGPPSKVFKIVVRCFL